MIEIVSVLFLLSFLASFLTMFSLCVWFIYRIGLIVFRGFRNDPLHKS